MPPENLSLISTSAKTFQGTGVLEEHLSDALRFTRAAVRLSFAEELRVETVVGTVVRGVNTLDVGDRGGKGS